MEGIFWISCAVIVYVYLGYPLLLCAWGRLRARPVVRPPQHRAKPAVSIVIASRNEGPRLAARLDNLLALDYPSDVQIVVVSDGSTDETLDVLARYDGRVDGIALAPAGKAVALNVGVAHARHEIVVFADTRQGFAPDALRALVAPFADPHVGGVTGELLLDGEPGDRRASHADRRAHLAWSPGGGDRRSWSDRRFSVASTLADGVGLYWRYEKWIRRHESAVGSTLGATGAIYALRRRLWRPLPPDTILDDVLAPMRVVMAGYRVVFAHRAQAFDRLARDARAEGRRKLRTLAGNYQLLILEPALLLPWRNPVWLQFVSHKLGRLVVPYALLGALVASVALVDRVFYAAALVAQAMFYGLAAYGWRLDRAAQQSGRPAPAPPAPSARAARVALTFLVMNGSAVAGLGALLRGKRVWR